MAPEMHGVEPPHEASLGIDRVAHHRLLPANSARKNCRPWRSSLRVASRRFSSALIFNRSASRSSLLSFDSFMALAPVCDAVIGKREDKSALRNRTERMVGSGMRMRG